MFVPADLTQLVVFTKQRIGKHARQRAREERREEDRRLKLVREREEWAPVYDNCVVICVTVSATENTTASL